MTNSRVLSDEEISNIGIEDGWSNYAEFARYVEAAVLAKVADKWQPIETAPKDRLVDILRNDRRYADCHYDRICDEYRHITACGVLIPLKGATHWMPQPAAPSPAQAEPVNAELTDEEIEEIIRSTNNRFSSPIGLDETIHTARAIIAADRAKRGEQ